MATTRDIKRQINSIVNIQKITSTMEKIATARIRKTQERLLQSRKFYYKFIDMAQLLLYEMDMRGIVLPKNNENAQILHSLDVKAKKDLLILISSNRGLCGGYNNNIIHAARLFMLETEEKGKEVDLYIIGKKAVSFFKFAGKPIYKSYTDIDEKMAMEDIAVLADDIIADYLAGKYNEINLLFTHYITPARQTVGIDKYLPLDISAQKELSTNIDNDSKRKIVLSTDIPLDEMYFDIIYRIAQLQLFHALMESQASEQVARKTAMKQATDSAGDMIVDLTKLYNRVRQTKITTELTEIVGAAKAME